MGKKLPEAERLKAWVRSGGRCVICNRYLLEGRLGYKELTFGELAHIVGQKQSERSPRGLNPLAVSKRDTADNVLLVCDDEHDELDKPGSSEVFTVEWLQGLKRDHEQRIRLVTGLAVDRGTTPLRMIGQVRGDEVEAGRDATSSAVIHSASRFPRFDLSFRDDIEIDLRNVPGEGDAGSDYYGPATAIIDDLVRFRLHEGIARDEIRHLSVFAFARLPLLVYLGSKLDDTVPTDIYQRHRSSESWEWPEPDATATFTADVPEPDPDHDEAVLVVNVSGSIATAEIPASIAHLPLFTLSIDTTPEYDVISGPKVLDEFTAACRHLLARTEETHKHVRRFHVLAAIPLCAAVTFGRVADFSVHPSFVMYDRKDHTYVAGLEVGGR